MVVGLVFHYFYVCPSALAIQASRITLPLNTDTATTQFAPQGDSHHDLLSDFSDDTYVYGCYTGYRKKEKHKVRNHTTQKGDIYEVRLWARMKAFDRDHYKVKPGISSSGIFAHKTIRLTTNYEYYFVRFQNDPKTNNSWTWDAIDNLKTQFKLSRPTHGVCVSECWLDVIFGTDQAYITNGPIFGGVTGESASGAHDAKIKIFAKANRQCNIKIRYNTSEADLKNGIGTWVDDYGVGVTKKTNYSCVQELSGLSPKTTYYFDIYVDDKSTYQFEPHDKEEFPWYALPHVKTFPVKGSPQNLSFCWGADSHQYPLQEDIWESIGNKNPDFLIHLGDLYGSNSSSYDRLSENYLKQLTWEGNSRHFMDAYMWHGALFGCYSDHDFVGNNSCKIGDCDDAQGAQNYDVSDGSLISGRPINILFESLDNSIKIENHRWVRHEEGDIIEVIDSAYNDGWYDIVSISDDRKKLFVNRELTYEEGDGCKVELFKHRTYNARDAFLDHRPTPDLYVTDDVTGKVSSGNSNSFVDDSKDLSDAEDRDKPWPGCVVWNLTDGSFGIIESVDKLNPLQITLAEDLKAGSDGLFEPGDNYRIGISALFHEFWYGDVQFVVLDTRYKRDPNGTEYNDMLDGRRYGAGTGEDKSNGTAVGHIQRDWLLDTINNSNAKVIFVCCEIPFNDNETAATDKWADYEGKGNNQHLREYIVSNTVKKNVVWLAGDRHFAAINYDGSGENPWPEACASSLGCDAPGQMHFAQEGAWEIKSNMHGAVAKDLDVGETNETQHGNDGILEDITLLPANPSRGDQYLFCGDAKFNSLWIDIGQAGIGNWTLVWKYYNGIAQWPVLGNVNDDSDGFRQPGMRQIRWDMPNDWQQTTVQGITGYWVKAKISTDNPITETQPKGNRAWINYKATWDEGDFREAGGEKRGAFGYVQVFDDRVTISCCGPDGHILTNPTSGKDLTYIYYLPTS